MIAHKIPISGHVTRIEQGRFIVVRGEVTESYNTDYYRIQVDHEERSGNDSKNDSDN